MKACLKLNRYDFYLETDSPYDLSEKVLKRSYSREIKLSDLPIDPFYLLKDSGVIYTLLDFDKYEGFYLLPNNLDNPNEKTMVGINKNRPISRQRFTAAHEMCHHIKDENTFYCYSYTGNDPIEKFADSFASNLLMPPKLLNEALVSYEVTKSMSDREYLDKILEISVLFGMSFLATFYRVNDIVKKVEFDKIKSISRKYKPENRKKELNIENEYILYSQLIDSYVFDKWAPNTKTMTDFQRLLITNDHRMENGTLSVDEISELLAEIRFVGIDNVKKNRATDGIELNDADLEILGQCEMYNKVFEKPSPSSIVNLLLLHQKFYSFAPFKEVGGQFREATARISGKSVSTCEPSEIPHRVASVLNDFDDKKNARYFNSKASVINYLIRQHHSLTVIHPFVDGNGRTTRAFFNQQLLIFGVPLFFIKVDRKDSYSKSLEICDMKNDYDSLFIFIVKNILDVYSQTI